MIKQITQAVFPLILLGAWFALVILGKAEADQFVNALYIALGGLGAHGIHKLKDK